jgi:hypothetical protein
MKHERDIVGLWGGKIPLYWSRMAKVLYNLRLLGDRPMTGGAFDAFMDGYAASMDIFPVGRSIGKSRSAEKIWADFVRISMDANRALEKVESLAARPKTTDRHEKSISGKATLRKISAGQV